MSPAAGSGTSPPSAPASSRHARESGFKVWSEASTEAFADPALKDLSLIVPIMTMSKIEKEELANLTAAVRGGVGLAGYHGGMVRRLPRRAGIPVHVRRERGRYPGGVIDYRVNINVAPTIQ